MCHRAHVADDLLNVLVLYTFYCTGLSLHRFSNARGFLDIMLYCMCLYVVGSRMLVNSLTCIVLYVFVCRFSNARGFLDMYCIVCVCLL